MIPPQARGKPINGKRFSTWINLFSGYRCQVNEITVSNWLDQFAKADQDTAARILDCVDFISHAQMAAAFREVLAGLPGWNKNPNQLQGKWRFVAFSSHAGESGDAMLHKFKVANNLNGKIYKPFFIYKSELMGEKLTSDDTVVFVDDFSGTGSQVCEAWIDNIAELLPNEPKTYLLLIAASTLARKRIEDETGLIPIPYRELGRNDNLFSAENIFFNKEEKKVLLKYGKRADKKIPKGYKDSGFVIVFAHGCPNNSIPILHAKNSKWKGLFPRYD